MIVCGSERLVLRHLNEADYGFMFELYNGEAFKRFIGDRGLDDLEKSKAYIKEKSELYTQGDLGIFAIEVKATGETVGVITFFKRFWLEQPDIGYALLPKFEGNGYAKEATEAYMNHLRSTKKVKTFAAITQSGNARSIALLERMGFNFQQTMTSPEEELGENINYFLKQFD